ncbi:adenosine receptor A2b-like [Diadema antillarum]|uniref:adenosine receptor A2b-like n=1 Tax=Diadema antillarum TaxID=105358 RepID=UPI003A88EC95
MEAIQNHQNIVIVIVTLLLILAVCVACGNTLVILAICRYLKPRTPTLPITLSLAVADLMTGLLGIPLLCFHGISYCILRSSSIFIELSAFPIRVLNIVSFFHVVALTVDRYLAVMTPLRYGSLVTTKCVALGIIVMWTTSGISVMLWHKSFFTDPNSNEYSATDWCNGQEKLSETADVATLATMSGLSLVAFVLLITSNLRVLTVAVKQANIIANMRRVIQPDGHNYNRHDGRLKAVKTTFVVVGTFCACWTPTLTYFFLRLTTNMSKEIYVVLVYVSHLVGTISSAVNPLIYGYRNKNFQDAFRKTIRCGLRTVMTED